MSDLRDNPGTHQHGEHAMYHVHFIDQFGNVIPTRPAIRSYSIRKEAEKVYQDLAAQYRAGKLPSIVTEVALIRYEDDILASTADN